MLGKTSSELDKPPVAREKGAAEILRVWGGDDLPQQYSLRTTWGDPGAWGLLLVDIAKHAARAYSASGGMTESVALARIKELFDAEWSAPTDVPERLE